MSIIRRATGGLIWLGLVFLLATSGLAQEEIIITTYYPTPHGDYEELRTDRLAVGSWVDMPTASGYAEIGHTINVGQTANIYNNLYVGTGGAIIDGSLEVHDYASITGHLSVGAGTFLGAEIYGQIDTAGGDLNVHTGHINVMAGDVDIVQGSLYVRQGDVEAGKQLISQAPDGTPPLVVASSTMVPNLNADLLDGYHINDIGVGYVPPHCTEADTLAGCGTCADIMATVDGMIATAIGGIPRAGQYGCFSSICGGALGDLCTCPGGYYMKSHHANYWAWLWGWIPLLRLGRAATMECCRLYP